MLGLDVNRNGPAMTKDNLIAQLEEMLEQAKSGDMEGFSFFCQKRSGAIWGYVNMSKEDLASASIAVAKQATDALVASIAKD